MSEDTHVYLANCCWGQWGEPEPKAIYYTLQKPEGHSSIKSQKYKATRSDVRVAKKAVIILPPFADKKASLLLSCALGGQIIHHFDKKGAPVFISLQY